MYCVQRLSLCLTILLGITRTSDGLKSEKYFRGDYTYLSIPDGFYKVHTQPRNWSEACYICGLEGASLYYPETAVEAENVLTFSRPNHNHKLYFVGIHDNLGNGHFKSIDGK